MLQPSPSLPCPTPAQQRWIDRTLESIAGKLVADGIVSTDPATIHTALDRCCGANLLQQMAIDYRSDVLARYESLVNRG